MEKTLVEPLNESQEKMGSAPEQTSSGKFLYLSAFAVNLIAFASGIGFAWTSPVIPKLRSEGPENPLPKPVTSLEESFLAGFIFLGATVGPFVAGQVSSKIGRKKTLLLAAFPMLASYLMTAFGHNLFLFYIARLFLGFGAGSVFTVLPAYLGEIAEDSNRGTLGCLLSVFNAAGLMFSYAVGPFLSVQWFSLSCTISLLVFIPIFYLFIPESPTYLLSIGDEIGAKESLMKLRGTIEVNKEIMQMSQSFEGAKGGAMDIIKTPSLRKALIITLALMFFQQFAGINAVLSYMQSIFASTGGNISPELSAIIIGGIQFIATILTSAIVDRLGRRILLLVSSLFSSFSVGVLGIFFYLKLQGIDVSGISWLPVASLIVYVIGFNLGLGPLAWAVMGEMFPSHVKSIANTLVSFASFFLAFLITFVFPPLTLIIGMAQSFWLFSVFSIASACFVYLFVPETKGRTVQEILEILGEGRKTDCS